MADKLAQISHLQRLKLLQAQQSLAKIKAEEDGLRRDLKTLNEHRRQSHTADPALMTMRSIGADVLWQGWIDRTQADLTVDLAKVLVRKEPIQRRVAREAGRDDVATELYVRASREKRQLLERKRLDDLLALATVLTTTPKRK